MPRPIRSLLGLALLALTAIGCWRPVREILPGGPALRASDTPAATEAIPQPTPMPTATPTPIPTPTMAPAELLSDASQALHDGDYSTAVQAYRELRGRNLDVETAADAVLGLGKAHLRDRAYSEAAAVFRQLLTEHSATEHAHEATFLLADALLGVGQPLSATEAYSSYLQAGTVITPYVNMSLGDAFRAAGDYTAAMAPYERAIKEAPNRSFEADGREKLAWTHIAQGQHGAAVDQYNAILSTARQPSYRAQIEHQAAETLLLAGNIDGGYERHRRVVETYPEEDHAYLSLVKLVQAGRPVNDLLRGQVDYYGKAYGQAVEALYRYIRAYPETHAGDAHWYAGLSFLEAGSVALAANEFQLLIDTHPENHLWGDAWLQLAKLRAGQGESSEALRIYRAFVEAAPTHSLAPKALWEAAQLAERTGATETAALSYLDCQSAYPSSDLAPEALFRAGLQLYQLGDLEGAANAWRRLTDGYSDSTHRPAALLWLGKLHLRKNEAEAAREALNAAIETEPDEYYGLRAAQIASDLSAAPSPAPQPRVGADDQELAEAWLAEWLGLESREGLEELSPRLASDDRLKRGIELWRLGRFQQAKTELEALRSATYSNAVDQYQLALAYGDLGLYRSSILAAWRVIGLSPVTNTVEAPAFVLRLAYPPYYENLVLENARRTGLEPRLIFSLIRQESLFESLATSRASAHGLMQVIPPTGAEIASELGWPPDYSTPDLYLPFVSLRFGTHYLAKQRDRFDGRIDVALAAYNGGPSNAARWLERAGEDRDLFLEQITLSETRLYVKLIQEHLAVYQATYSDFD
ncbi:MAG: tetratricopeptide repeat protein [Anaerolineae bacterium]